MLKHQPVQDLHDVLPTDTGRHRDGQALTGKVIDYRYEPDPSPVKSSSLMKSMDQLSSGQVRCDIDRDHRHRLNDPLPVGPQLGAR